MLLLNSDTVVTSGWLERLAACAASDPTIATATPFSNNAEICSFPEFCVANPPPEDAERVARVRAANLSHPRKPGTKCLGQARSSLCGIACGGEEDRQQHTG